MKYDSTYTDTIEVKDGDDGRENPHPKRIETDRLVMRPILEAIEPSDMYELYKKFTDTDRWFNSTMGIPDTYQSTLDYFQTIEELRDDKSDFFYVIEEKDTGDILGQATIEDVDFHAEKCGIGIWIRKDRWGEGISKERAEGLIYSIFESMRIQTVEVQVAKQNDISISAVDSYMQEFGGKYDGCLRNDSITPKHEVISVYVWSITEDEFFDQDSTYQRDPISLPNEH